MMPGDEVVGRALARADASNIHALNNLIFKYGCSLELAHSPLLPQAEREAWAAKGRQLRSIIDRFAMGTPWAVIANHREAFEFDAPSTPKN